MLISELVVAGCDEPGEWIYSNNPKIIAAAFPLIGGSRRSQSLKSRAYTCAD